MRPFFLLSDITGSLAMLGLAALVIGVLLLFAGIRLQPTSATATASKSIGYVAMAFGMLIALIALAFLSAVWDSQPEQVAKRQMEEMEASRQDTSGKAQARQSQQELNQFEQSFEQQIPSLADSSERRW